MPDHRRCISLGPTPLDWFLFWFDWFDGSDTETTKRSVGFQNVEIREYGVVLGDNPAAFTGPPITIDWEHQGYRVLRVDDFERTISEHTRRRGMELRLSGDVRERLLEKLHTPQEMQEALEDVQRAQIQRIMAIEADEIDDLRAQIWQSMKRKFKRWHRRRRGVPLDPAEAWIENYKQEVRRHRRTISDSYSVQSATSGEFSSRSGIRRRLSF